MQRVKRNLGYVPPSTIRIQRASEVLGMDTRAVDAIQDMSVLVAGGGTPVTGAEMRELVKEEARRRPLKATQDGKYLIRELGEVYDNPTPAHARQEEMLYDFNIGMRDFMVAAAQDPLVIGKTPMDTALLTFKAMREINEGAGDGDSDDPEMQALQNIIGNGTSTYQETKQRMQAASQLDKFEQSMLLGTGYKPKGGDGDGSEDSGSGSGTGRGETFDEALAKQIHIAKILDSDIQDVMRIARRLSTLSNMNNPSFSRFKATPSGDEVQYRRMKSLGELPEIRSSSFAYMKRQPTLFKHKLIQRDFQVRERGIMRDRQQLLYVLVDSSGSMNGSRRIMAAGALMNRIKSVVKGDAKLWFAMFDDDIGVEHQVHTVEEAKGAAIKLARGEFSSGGGTCIDRALSKCIKRINKKLATEETLIRPEILLVSDGDDQCCLKFDDLKGIRLNTIVCQAGIQPDIKKLAHASRGVYVNLD